MLNTLLPTVVFVFSCCVVHGGKIIWILSLVPDNYYYFHSAVQ